MSQTDQPKPSNQPHQSGGGSLHTLAIVGLVIIAVLGLGFAGYAAESPRVTTVTQQELLTNTQSFTNTVTNTIITTSATTITRTSTTTSTTSTGFFDGYGNGYGYYPGYPNYQNCGASCPPNSNYLSNYDSCNVNSAQPNGSVQCYGYIFQDSGGCTELAVPVPNPPYFFESPVTQYYGLHNLPSSSPPIGSWVTVNGQWHQGTNTSPSGGACPINYLNVTSISS